ncbi:PF07588 family protein [Leptospira wolbachii serovar Codice str. CDC]|uniref:PF07588 family protein n=1 Tax=Leptospira wolbachii serovar Codice str. CDC TaxID=1218599 RepID=R9A4N9_9LEPT|nr:DUF1554 domain-containing protein [Leptospira wolbachii]EOQ97178.1 PF07588 family protein [Leptospira wolbachii serovar Codice str. CDC]
MRFSLFVSFLSVGWLFSCTQVNPRDELLFTLVNGLNPISTTTSSVSVVSSAKINVSSTSILLKYGTPQNFGISLVRQPTANVDITFTFTNTKLTINGSGTSPTPTPLTFTSGNYNVVQTVSLDSTIQTLDSSTLTITATSADPFYNTSGTVSISHQRIYLEYTGNAFIFQQSVAAPSLTPSISFVITNCSVAPSLPAGLSLNSSNCVISGTPTSSQAGSTYTVTATNGTDSDSHNITIQIEPTVYKVFVTAATFDGNLLGITGADAKCAADTNKPATGTYKAMITDGTNRVACTTDNCGGGPGENFNWVFQPGEIYVRSTDSASLFTANASGIILAPAANMLNHSFDSGTPAKEYWTGFAQTSYWQEASPNAEYTCSNWTSNAFSADGGRVGASNSTTYSAIRSGSGRSCDANYYLLCVEQ